MFPDGHCRTVLGMFLPLKTVQSWGTRRSRRKIGHNPTDFSFFDRSLKRVISQESFPLSIPVRDLIQQRLTFAQTSPQGKVPWMSEVKRDLTESPRQHSGNLECHSVHVPAKKLFFKKFPNRRLGGGGGGIWGQALICMRNFYNWQHVH